MSAIALVVARAANGVIGAEGRIPWHISEDLRRFRRITTGKPCIMGRKTWESLPKKPLPDRLNIVVTRDHAFCAPGAAVATSLDEAICRALSESSSEIAVIGGAQIYRESLPCAERVYLTDVQAEFAGDARFPELNRKEWRETSREEHVSPDGLRYAFVTLERARGEKL
jgi:dihydrofolate reductase